MDELLLIVLNLPNWRKILNNESAVGRKRATTVNQRSCVAVTNLENSRICGIQILGFTAISKRSSRDSLTGFKLAKEPTLGPYG
jgi:hypothetical protein